MAKEDLPNEVEHTDDSGKGDLILYILIAAVLLAAAYLYYTKAI